MSKGEVWKDVVGYEGFYKVSNKGNVRSVVRKDSIGRKCGGRTLKPACHRDGYIYAVLCKNGVGSLGNAVDISVSASLYPCM